MRRLDSYSEAETRQLGGELAARLRVGDVVLLGGELGAGKTTLVRGLIQSLGHDGPVRSPTFNLIQTFDTRPPVMHADLYRVRDAEGIGLEDFLQTHVCLIEWPDRLGTLLDPNLCWRVTLEREDGYRTISIEEPIGFENC